METLDLPDVPNGLARLQDRVWQARFQGRDDRVLAAVDLARELVTHTKMRRLLEALCDDARLEFIKDLW